MKNPSPVHLVLLVGTNPLPVWLAFSYLEAELPSHGQRLCAVTLAYTEKTAGEMRRLREAIETKKEQALFRSCQGPTFEILRCRLAAGQPKKIREELLKHLQEGPEAERVHLHYTGGTKAMVLAASHACREYAGETRRVEESYLNPREGIPALVGSEGILYAPDARCGIEMTLEDLAALHGLEVRSFSQGPQETFPPEEIDNDLSKAETNRGKLLEKTAYAALGRVLEKHQRRDLKTQAYWNVVLQRQDQERGKLGTFQVDVLGLIGPQMVLVSCTTSRGRDAIKGKAFEALHRARQLGGDEAKIIVLSGGEARDVEGLEENLQEETGSDEPPLVVWGRETWEYLEGYMDRYLRRLLR